MLPLVANCQPWFQASMEYVFANPAGYAVSNEIGNNWSISKKLTLSPSVDFTYYPEGSGTRKLLFECLTFSVNLPLENYGIVPFVSVTAAHVDMFLVNHKDEFGGSFQLGTLFIATDRVWLFFQYRYFMFTHFEGQLTQFGFMYVMSKTNKK